MSAKSRPASFGEFTKARQDATAASGLSSALKELVEGPQQRGKRPSTVPKAPRWAFHRQGVSGELTQASRSKASRHENWKCISLRQGRDQLLEHKTRVLAPAEAYKHFVVKQSYHRHNSSAVMSLRSRNFWGDFAHSCSIELKWFWASIQSGTLHSTRSTKFWMSSNKPQTGDTSHYDGSTCFRAIVEARTSLWKLKVHFFCSSNTLHLLQRSCLHVDETRTRASIKKLQSKLSNGLE